MEAVITEQLKEEAAAVIAEVMPEEKEKQVAEQIISESDKGKNKEPRAKRARKEKTS